MTRSMNFISVRIITDDVPALVRFYEELTGLDARWAAPEFAEIVTDGCTLAIGSTRTMQLFGPDIARAAANRTAILEFIVEDVDREFERVGNLGEVVQQPTTMPWGNRSLLLRDPDGNLVNLFTPQTAEAAARFTR
ncbi:VOC family protein [Microlunatus endophyticus]|nr:VOC family protein [Microlunatus endophyticus]